MWGGRVWEAWTPACRTARLQLIKGACGTAAQVDSEREGVAGGRSNYKLVLIAD